MPVSNSGVSPLVMIMIMGIIPLVVTATSNI